MYLLFNISSLLLFNTFDSRALGQIFWIINYFEACCDPEIRMVYMKENWSFESTVIVYRWILFNSIVFIVPFGLINDLIWNIFASDPSIHRSWNLSFDG